eukprot:scpid77345/ scgid19700/ 
MKMESVSSHEESRQEQQQAIASSPILRLMSALRDKRRGTRRINCRSSSLDSREESGTAINVPNLKIDDGEEEDLGNMNDSPSTDMLLTPKRPIGRRASAPSQSLSSLPNTLSCPAKLEVIVSGGKVITRRRPSTVSSCPVTPRRVSAPVEPSSASLGHQQQRQLLRSRNSALSVSVSSQAMQTPRTVYGRICEESENEEKRSHSLTELDKRREKATLCLQRSGDNGNSASASNPLDQAAPLRRSLKFNNLPTTDAEAQRADGRYILSGSQRSDCSIRFPLRCAAVLPDEQGMRQLSVF